MCPVGRKTLLNPIQAIIKSLQESDLGCHLGKEYVGGIVYANDVLLLSTSDPVVQLQRMLDLCVECGDKLDIIFNASKSVLFKVGKIFGEKLDNLYLGMKVFYHDISFIHSCVLSPVYSVV